MIKIYKMIISLLKPLPTVETKFTIRVESNNGLDPFKIGAAVMLTVIKKMRLYKCYPLTT